MIWVELVGIVLLWAEASWLMRRHARFFEARVVKQDDLVAQRQHVLYKQQKEATRVVLRSDKAVRAMADEGRRLHQDTRLMQQRTDALVANPSVRRLLGSKDDPDGR